MSAFHLAQVNIGLPIEPVESERLRGFVELLEPINALADVAPGFVWRLQTEDGDATAIRAFDDERLIMNMSVWESVEAYAAFVFGPEHSRGDAPAPPVVRADAGLHRGVVDPGRDAADAGRRGRAARPAAPARADPGGVHHQAAVPAAGRRRRCRRSATTGPARSDQTSPSALPSSAIS